MIDKEIEDKIAKGFNLYASYPGVPRRIEQILAEEKLRDELDEIANPGHYCRGTIDPWTYAKDTFTHAELIGAFKLNIIKYIHRFQHKGTPLRDLQKARAYLDQLIALYDH